MTQIFTITNLTPIGFRELKYPVKYCCLCRGLLNDTCYTCYTTNNTECHVIKVDDKYYHTHCKNVTKSCNDKK